MYMEKKEKKVEEHGESIIFTKIARKKRKEKREENVRSRAFALGTWKRGRWPSKFNEICMWG